MTWTSPVRGRVSSLLRFRSRVFSTPQRFPGKPRLHGLVSCRNRSRDSLLQSFPLAKIAHPSRGHLLPCGYLPAFVDELPESLSPPVSPTPTLSRSCLAPRTTMPSLSTHPPNASTNRGPLPHPSNTLPGQPGSRAAEPSRPTGFTRFEALILPRVRSHRHELPRDGGRYSPGLLPL
jgi:hypothetical protein